VYCIASAMHNLIYHSFFHSGGGDVTLRHVYHTRTWKQVKRGSFITRRVTKVTCLGYQNQRKSGKRVSSSVVKIRGKSNPFRVSKSLGMVKLTCLGYQTSKSRGLENLFRVLFRVIYANDVQASMGHPPPPPGASTSCGNITWYKQNLPFYQTII